MPGHRGTPAIAARPSLRIGILPLVVAAGLLFAIATTSSLSGVRKIGADGDNSGQVVESDPSGSPGDSPVPRGDKSPYTLAQIREIFASEAIKPRFDGQVAGWRVADYATLTEAGIGNKQIELRCEPFLAKGETATDLDFTLGYLPTDAKVHLIEGPVKWVCDDRGLVVSETYSVETELGVGEIWIERSVQAERSLEISVPSDRIDEIDVHGHKAIAIHPADDSTGLGYGLVAVIEDDVEPEFVLLEVGASNAVPFDELVKIVEGIR